MSTHQIQLEVKNLTTCFRTSKGNVTAVDDVSFSLKKSETLCIVGESGSGKTTIAKTILGLHTSLIGKLNFNNQEIDLLTSFSFFE